MKKLLYSAMILLLASATSCKQNDDKCKICNETNCQITHVKCDACGEWDCEENHWATTLGIASFASDTIWTISNGTITQTWSDVVQTDSCSGKTAFDGGNYTTSFYNVDCRSNPGQKGDLFSWRAVKEVVGICPQGWRVPDTADFRNLDIALGFNGQNRYQETINGHSWQDQLDAYLTIWGGCYGVSCYSDGLLSGQGFSGIYWSQSEGSADSVILLGFNTNGNIDPQGWGNKGSGFALRCVR